MVATAGRCVVGKDDLTIQHVPADDVGERFEQRRHPAILLDARGGYDT
jgi:hypothetical protein